MVFVAEPPPDDVVVCVAVTLPVDDMEDEEPPPDEDDVDVVAGHDALSDIPIVETFIEPHPLIFPSLHINDAPEAILLSGQLIISTVLFM